MGRVHRHGAVRGVTESGPSLIRCGGPATGMDAWPRFPMSPHHNRPAAGCVPSITGSGRAIQDQCLSVANLQTLALVGYDRAHAYGVGVSYPVQRDPPFCQRSANRIEQRPGPCHEPGEPACLGGVHRFTHQLSRMVTVWVVATSVLSSSTPDGQAYVVAVPWSRVGLPPRVHWRPEVSIPRQRCQRRHPAVWLQAGHASSEGLPAH